MFKADNKIYIKEWLKLKPYDTQSPTDIYYLKICNEVKKILLSEKSLLLEIPFLKAKDLDFLACFLVSYLEDLISDTNIWNSFIRIHHRFYDKFLPFYNLDDYYEEEINSQDISFLIWYFVSTKMPTAYIAPLSNLIVSLSNQIMELFDSSWDHTPSNPQLKGHYTLAETNIDFYDARYFLDKILFKTYLTYPDTGLKLQKSEMEIIEETEDRSKVLMLLNENRDSIIHNSHTRLLGLKAVDWAKAIIGENHALFSSYSEMSQKISGTFLYKGQDKNNIKLEHAASGKKFDLTKQSFDNHAELSIKDTIIFIGIVRWENEWWFSGIYFQQEYDINIVLKEKQSTESQKAVAFLDFSRKEIQQSLDLQLEKFLAFNNDSLIAFMEGKHVQPFYEKYIEFYNDSMMQSHKDSSVAEKWAKEEGAVHESEIEFGEINESSLVFFNPKGGLEIAFGINSAFHLPQNPYFDPKESIENLIFLVSSNEISKELVEFCFENCQKDLPYFQTSQGRTLLENLDFLMRFWKSAAYFTKPALRLLS